jgi:hypothetical protein
MKRKLMILLALAFMTFALQPTVHAADKGTPKETRRTFTVPLEGYFYLDVYTGKMYWYVAGQVHHIESWDTYLWLFNNADAYQISVYGIATLNVPVGASLPRENGLVSCLGAVYLRINSNLYHVHSTTEFDFYHLNWGVVVPIPNLTSYYVVPGGFGPNMNW